MQRLLLLSLALVVAACAGESQVAAADAADASGHRVGSNSTGDAAALDATPTSAFFELGTNTTGKSTPQYYQPLPAGAKINVELGPQGLWMVVLAFRTQAMLKPPLILGGKVEMDGALLGELKLGKQKLLPGPGGDSYYYNFFLVVAPEGVDGREATIHFTASDADGEKVNLKHQVVLTGGK